MKALRPEKPINYQAEAFRKMVSDPFKLKLFFLKSLPMAFLAGLRLRHLDHEKAVVTIPFKYLNKNPFRSIYFACLAMAAELSTGVLSMMAIYKSRPPVSMLVVGMEAKFYKKAIGLISFTCADGQAIFDAVAASKETGEGRTVVTTSIGTDEAGDKIAEFKLTWSFKAKKA
jgi:hypothetical protein